MKLHSISAMAFAGFATAAFCQAPATSRMDDLVERFAVIVQRDARDDPEPWSPPGLREDLVRMNPGQERNIDELVSRASDCVERQIAQAMPHAMRSAARALGEDRLAQLVAFFEGPGSAIIERLARGEGVPPMSKAEANEWERLGNDYRRFMYSIPNHLDFDTLERMTRCYEEEAARLNLRLE